MFKSSQASYTESCLLKHAHFPFNLLHNAHSEIILWKWAHWQMSRDVNRGPYTHTFFAHSMYTLTWLVRCSLYTVEWSQYSHTFTSTVYAPFFYLARLLWKKHFYWKCSKEINFSNISQSQLLLLLLPCPFCHISFKRNVPWLGCFYGNNMGDHQLYTYFFVYVEGPFT